MGPEGDGNHPSQHTIPSPHHQPPSTKTPVMTGLVSSLMTGLLSEKAGPEMRGLGGTYIQPCHFIDEELRSGQKKKSFHLL